MGISDYALDKFVAQHMSKLTQLDIRSLAEDFPESDNWFRELVLKRIFHVALPEDKAALAFAIIRRTHAAVQDWELASIASGGNLRSIATYFNIMRHLENCISSTWQGLAFVRKSTGEALFARGDGSVYERLNWIYNVSRHFDPEGLPAGDLHRTWLSDDAIHTREHKVNFAELRDVISMLGRISERVSRPI